MNTDLHCYTPSGGNASAPGTKAIEVEKISKRFGDFVAVNEISFSVSEGEIF